MGKFLPMMVLVFFLQPSLAQTSYLDSCLTLLKEHETEDSIYLNLLNEIAFEYNYSDPRKGLSYADSAIELAKKLQLDRKLASAYSHKGVNYGALGNDSAALTMYALALAIHTRIENKTGAAITLNNMAIIHVNNGNYARALELHAQAYSVWEQTGNRPRMATALNNIGVVYFYLADYHRALEYYLRALEMREKLGESWALADNFTNIGIIYKNIGDYEKAVAYHQRALQLYEKNGNKQGTANAFANIGVAFNEAKNTEQALQYFQKSLTLNRYIGNEKKIAGDLTNIGILYKQTGQYSQAVAHLQNALELYAQAEDKNNASSALNHLAKIYMEVPAGSLAGLQIDTHSRYIQAQQYLEQALQLAQATGAPDRLSEVWESLSDVYAARGDFFNAFSAYRQHIVFRDSVYNVESEKQLTRRVMQFEFEKKEAETMAAVMRQRFVNKMVVGVSMVLLLAGATVFVFYKRKRDAEEQRKEAELRAEAADIEMKALRLQMNPHFIFNSLNSISQYITTNNLADADLYLTRFARLMRLTLENAEQRAVPLASDLEALEMYLQLESLRLQHRFTWNIIIDPSADPDNILIPPLLLQPLVENSILHGMADKTTGGVISICIEVRDEKLYCMVEDNGPGIAATTRPHAAGTSNKQSMGLKITQSRIDMINKTQMAGASLTLSPLSPGTRATVVLPLELRF